MKPIPRIYAWAIVASLLILLIIGLASCYSVKKAKKQFARAVATYDTIGSNYCARTFPEKVITDSTEYKKSLQALHDLRNIHSLDSLDHVELMEELEQELINLRSRTPDTVLQLCDSLEDPLIRKIIEKDRYIKILEKKQFQIN